MPIVLRLSRHPLFPLGLVAVIATIVNLTVVPIKLGLGWDEIVYVSQVAGQGETAAFSAPRSRGVALLAAPIAGWSASWPLLRVYLALVMGILLVLAFWPWTRVLGRPGAHSPHNTEGTAGPALDESRRGPIVVAIAAGLFAIVPVLQFYWSSAMPNGYVALGAVAAVGWLVEASRRPGARGPLIGLAGALAFTGLMRPSDTFWLAAVLLVACAVRPFRAWKSALTVIGGTVAGVLPWLIEATISYGGPFERLGRASEIQGGTGPTFSGVMHLDALNGPLLCRPCAIENINWPGSLWWLLLPLAVAAAIWISRDRGPLILATVAAAAISFTYLFLIDYAAPRFLFPVYALLSIPVAVLIDRLIRSRRRVLAVAVVAALIAHAGMQGLVLIGIKNTQFKVRQDYRVVAERLHSLGIRPSCLVVGQQAIAIAYYARCESAAPTGNNKNIDLPTMLRRIHQEPSALVVSGHGPPPYARAWKRYPVGGLKAGEPWDIYLPGGATGR